MQSARWQLLVLMLVIGVSACFANDSVPITVTNQNRINSSDILAEYDGGVITRQDLDNKISKIPANSQARYRTTDGQIQVLDIMAVEEAFMAKAIQLGTASDPEVNEKIKASSRQFLVQEYYKRNVGNLIVVTEADKKKYYDENKQAFYLYPYISISYIQAADEASANKAVNELKAGKSFAEVSDLYNVNNYAKGLKGVIKNIRLNGNIPGVGNDLELEKLISSSQADSTIILGPFQTTTGWHVFRTNEYAPGRQKDFQEVLPELEQRTRPGVETRMLNDLKDRLKLKYSVVMDSTRVAEIDLVNRAKNKDIEDLNLVSSTNPELNITVRNILDKYAKLSQQEQMFFSKGEGAQQLLDQELISALLYADAKDQNFEELLVDNADYVQMRRFFVLNAVYKSLVLDKVVVNSTDTKAYYDEHLSEFTTPGFRSIQALWFDNEVAANRILKKYTRYAKLGDDKRIAELIEKNSTKPKLALLDNIYQNGVITGIGPDAAFSAMVWDNPVGYISPVFKSTRGDILFFRIMNEKPSTAQSFTEVEPRIFGTLKKTTQDAQQEKVTQELFTEFNMVKYPERLSLQLTAEEMFNMADNSAKQRNFRDAITFYDQIIKSFPNGSDDYRASFMKAFIVAEELKDEPQALQLFKDFLKKYPTGDLNESAEFMIDSLEGNNPLDMED